MSVKRLLGWSELKSLSSACNCCLQLTVPKVIEYLSVVKYFWKISFSLVSQSCVVIKYKLNAYTKMMAAKIVKLFADTIQTTHKCNQYRENDHERTDTLLTNKQLQQPRDNQSFNNTIAVRPPQPVASPPKVLCSF